MTEERDPALANLCGEDKYRDSSEFTSQSPVLTGSPRSRSLRIGFLVTSAVAIAGLLVFLANSWPNSSRLKYDQCGTTADEARARGCVFETTGFTWLTPECADPDTEAEFLTYIVQNGLKLYRTENYTEQVSIEEVRKGNGDGFFVRQQYHLTHCLFLMKKKHRMEDKGAMSDGQIMPLHHTEHCMGQVLAAQAEEDFRKHDIQFSYTKFPYCGKPGGYNLEWPMRGTWIDF